MHTGVSDIAFKLSGVFHYFSYHRIRALGFCCKVFDIFKTVCEIELRCFTIYFRHFVRHKFRQSVGFRKWQFKHFGHVFNSHFGCHCAIGDDVSHLLFSIFLCDIFQHSSATIIIEVDIDIRQRDTVGVKETLKQEVIFDRVYLCNTQAVGCCRTCCRTTTRTYADTELLACHIDEILYNQEVTRETHCLHNV